MLAVGIIIVALVVALLAVPVVLVLDVERVETLEARWHVRWLFGLVDVQSSRRRRKGSPSERSETATSRHKSPKERRSRARMGIAVLRTRGLLRRVVRLVVTLFRQVTFEEVRLRTTLAWRSCGYWHRVWLPDAVAGSGQDTRTERGLPADVPGLWLERNRQRNDSRSSSVSVGCARCFSRIASGDPSAGGGMAGEEMNVQRVGKIVRVGDPEIERSKGSSRASRMWAATSSALR